MRIIALSSTVFFKSGISGGDIVFPHINRFLDHDKFKVEVITAKFGKEIWEGLKSDAKIHAIPNTFFDDLQLFSFIPVLYIIRTFFVMAKLKKLLQENREEETLIYTCSDFFPDVIPAFLFKIFNNDIKWVARVYHIIKPPHKRKANIIFSILSFAAQKFSFLLIGIGADLVLSLSGTFKDLQRIFSKNVIIKVNNLGIDLKAIESAKKYDKDFAAVFVGGLTPTKGIYDLLEIWHRVCLEIPDAKLAIIGGGSKREINIYGDKVKKHSIKNNIDYLGFLPKNEDVYAILKASKIFIYTGHENGWSLPAAEAFACKVPCVSYKLKLFGTAFHKGFITVELYDYDAFAKVAINLLKDETKRLKLSEEAYEEAQRLDWQNVAAEFSRIVSEVFIKQEKY